MRLPAGLPALKAMIDRELVLMARTFFVYIVKAVQACYLTTHGGHMSCLAMPAAPSSVTRTTFLG